MGKKLTQEQVDSFHRDGFLSPIDIFSEEKAPSGFENILSWISE